MMHRELAFVSLIVICHIAFAFFSKWNYSATVDEPLHIAGGYCYWAYNDYRIHPENGNLPQRILSLPTWWFLGNSGIDRTRDLWRDADQVEIERELVFGSGRDHRFILASARLVNSFLSGALILLVYLCTRKCFGVYAAMWSTSLAAFCPNLIAHGGLATSDTCAAFFTLLALWCVARTLSECNWARLILCGVVMGSALLSKFSGPLIVISVTFLVFFHLASSKGTKLAVWNEFELRGPVQRLMALILAASVVVTIAWCEIWLCFSFRYSGFADNGPHYYFQLRSLKEATDYPSFVCAIARTLGDWHLLPEAYLYGLVFVLRNAAQRPAFLMGEYSLKGWWYYFPIAFLVKTPLPVLGTIILAIATSAVMFTRRWTTFRKEELEQLPSRMEEQKSVVANRDESGLLLASLGIYLIVVWIVLLTSSLNIGLRHALSTYPIVYILCGAIWSTKAPLWLARSGVALVLINMVLSVLAYPNYLPYFNQLIASNREFRVLVDSNLDWGQDLPELAQILAEPGFVHPNDTVQMSYFGPVEPECYGIQCEPISFRPGIYCVSVTNLVRVYTTQAWTRDHEEDYRTLEHGLQVMNGLKSDPDIERLLAADNDGQFKSALNERFRFLAVERLFNFLEKRKPDRIAGKSIFVYRLSARDIERALK